MQLFLLFKLISTTCENIRLKKVEGIRLLIKSLTCCYMMVLQECHLKSENLSHKSQSDYFYKHENRKLSILTKSRFRALVYKSSAQLEQPKNEKGVM